MSSFSSSTATSPHRTIAPPPTDRLRRLSFPLPLHCLTADQGSRRWSVSLKCSASDAGRLATEEEEERHRNQQQQQRFVGCFRQAWPYIRGHRGSTFVVVISGEIVDSPCLDSILQDISLLHGLGIKFVIVPATNVHIDRVLAEKGREGSYVGQYRITDPVSLDAAMEAAGRVKHTIEAKLSPGPPALSLRRHGDSGRWHELGACVATGNFIAAKRRGVVEGIDYGETGEVKRVNVSRIWESLERDSIVVVSNLGYSSSGGVLNCNSYEVATACALAMKADKLICIVDGQILDESGQPVRFMTLQDADLLIRKRAERSETAANYVKAIAEGGINYPRYHHLEADGDPAWNEEGSSGISNATFHNGVGFDNGNGFWSGRLGFPVGGKERLSRLDGYLSELAAAVYVCRGGVQRVHLVDGTLGGALLLELFTRDGVGTMVARDVYEGTRMARPTDFHGIKQLIQPLEECDALVQQTNEELLEALDSFIVVERDGSIIACTALFPFFDEKCGEVAAFVVSPGLRGHGKGDRLLDYIEKMAYNIGLEKLFLLTTRTADWFVRRGFKECSIGSVPLERRKEIKLSSGSKYYMKILQPEVGGITADSFAVKSY